MEVWESLIPTQGAKRKWRSPYPQLKGPHKSVAVRIPKSKSHTKVRNSISPTQGPTPKRGSLYSQLKAPCKSVVVRIPTSRGHEKA